MVASWPQGGEVTQVRRGLGSSPKVNINKDKNEVKRTSLEEKKKGKKEEREQTGDIPAH